MNTKSIEQYHLHKKDPSARQFELFDLATYLAENAEHSNVPHSHSFYQLIWFQSNLGAHHVDFEAHAIEKDRVFLIAKNQVHYFESEVKQEGILMHFNESFLLHNETDMELFIQYGLFNSDKPFVQLPKALKPRLMALKEEIKIEEIQGNAFGHRLIISLLLRTILVLLERVKRNSSSLDASNPSRTVFLQFRAALEANFKEESAVADYAALLHISSKTLSAYCKKETGQSASTLIANRRILEAKRLLLHTNALVNQVAFSIGFEDPSYFVKFFKKEVGMTPLQFRKAISE